MRTYLQTGVLLGLLTVTGVAQADWSANLGYASEYHYRGILQKNSSANGGIDYEAGGFTPAPGRPMSATVSKSISTAVTALTLVR